MRQDSKETKTMRRILSVLKTQIKVNCVGNHGGEGDIMLSLYNGNNSPGYFRDQKCSHFTVTGD